MLFHRAAQLMSFLLFPMTRTLQSSAVPVTLAREQTLPSSAAPPCGSKRFVCLLVVNLFFVKLMTTYFPEQTHQISVMCGCTRNGATCEIARIKKKSESQQVEDGS